jgi:hypothetical protein
MVLAFYSQNNKIKPLALHKYMEKKNKKARTGGSQSQRVGGSQTVAVVID